jgi:hypothetical protein
MPWPWELPLLSRSDLGDARWSSCGSYCIDILYRPQPVAWQYPPPDSCKRLSTVLVLLYYARFLDIGNLCIWFMHKHMRKYYDIQYVYILYIYIFRWPVVFHSHFLLVWLSHAIAALWKEISHFLGLRMSLVGVSQLISSK